MKHKTLMHGILALGIIATVICIGMVNGFTAAKPFISVDPVSDKNVGEAFTITGKTSLPAGTKILAEVYPSSFEDNSGTGSGEFSGATGTITIAGSKGGPDTWDFAIDTSSFQPVEYLVTVSSFKGDPAQGDYSKGDISGTTKFAIHPGHGTTGASQSTDKTVAGGILIDPIHDKTAGDLLVVTGKTNLSVGTNLIVKVIPESMDNATIMRYYENPEIAAETKVVKGSGPNNLFSVSLDTRSLSPAEHLILVSDVQENATGPGSRSGSFTGSTLFNILEGSAGSGQYIRINPVTDKITGDLLIISGSTNLPAGTILIVKAGHTGGDTMVRAGTGGVNRFSSPVDTSVMEPGTKKIEVTDMVGDPAKGNYRRGDVNATASFTLKGTYLTTDTPVKPTITNDDFIRINAIGDRSIGDQFLVTGTTSLPVGTEVLWQVTPASLTTDSNPSGTMTGMMANSQVTKGTGNNGRVSLAMDTYVLLPGQYNVSVSTSAGDLSKGDFRTGDLTGSAFFTVK